MRTTNLFTSLSISTALLLAASFGFVGCKKDGDTTPPDATTGDAAEGGEAAEGGDAAEGGEAEGGDAAEGGDDGPVAWDDMDRNQRQTFMGVEVMPKMKELFKQQGFDTFKCANCHGEDYKDVDFAMPNDLTPLNPDNPIQSGMDLDEDVTKFMVSVVLPQMAEMLGEETDVTTGKGEFGCLSCHLSE